jgi:predicted DCC family thiol-disulfide oxidoreductase YuxK
MLMLVPRLVRNWGYDFVALHRYRWFGKKEACRLPTSDERARFLP